MSQIRNRAGNLILLEFTRSLLKNTDSYRTSFINEGVREILFYHNQIEKDKEKEEFNRGKDIREVVREKIKEDSKIIGGLKKEIGPSGKKLFNSEQSPRNYPGFFNIPDFLLPENVRYLKPIPRSEQINLGRLNNLLNDPLVKVIECGGPDQKIIVEGIMGRKSTPTSLNEEEINDVINIFSKMGRMPVKPGLFKVAFGNLVLSALISDVVGSKFSIKKFLFPIN